MIDPLVYVIILNYNHLEDLKETISSFNSQDYSNIHLVVTDNGSDASSLAWLRTNHPKIRVIENRENLGWAEGNNIGIRHALEQKADYILLANNDLSFNNPKIISSLVRQIKENPKWIMGPTQNFYYHPEQVFSIGHNFMNISNPVYNNIRKEYLKYNIDFKRDNLKVVDYVAGSFVLFPSGLIRDIGWIDTDFFLYGEDADFFLRAWKKGYVSIVDQNLKIFHKVSKTSGNKSPLKAYYQTRNVWRNFEKHSDIGNHILYFKIKVVKSILKTLANDIFHFRLKRIKALLLGFLHGAILHKYGKYY